MNREDPGAEGPAPASALVTGPARRHTAAVDELVSDQGARRVGDADREAADARLQQAVGAGTLTLQDDEQRTGRVWAAGTRADLDAVTADLPPADPVRPLRSAAPAGAPAPGTRPRTRRVLAVLSGEQSTGPVAPGQGVEAYAVMGGACVDLRRDDLPAEVRVRAVAVMGGVEVLVPPGVAVELNGLSVMGGRGADVQPPRPGAPVVRVDAYAVMGGVAVGHGDEPRARPAWAPPPAPLPPVGLPPSRLPAPSGHGSLPVARRRRRPGVVKAALLGALVFGGVQVAQTDHASWRSSTDAPALIAVGRLSWPEGPGRQAGARREAVSPPIRSTCP